MAILRILGRSETTIEAIGIIAACLLLFKIADALWNQRKQKVRRKFKHLDSSQKEFLRTHFQSGSRRIALHEPISSKRWLEELQEWNYIKFIRPIILSDTYAYDITRNGWKEIEKNWSKSK